MLFNISNNKVTNSSVSQSKLILLLDYEFSKQLNSTLKEHQLNYQLVPPNVHRRYAAERAIQTFKNHFLSVLATVDQ